MNEFLLVRFARATGWMAAFASIALLAIAVIHPVTAWFVASIALASFAPLQLQAAR